MSLPDSFYIALCMTILLVGAVYWVWTQIQFVQRKVNVLENIVYELKTLYSKQSELDGPVAPAKYPPAPTSVIGEEDEDLLRETLHAEEEYADSQADMLPSASPTMVVSDVVDVLGQVAHEIEVEEIVEQHPLMKPFEDTPAAMESSQPEVAAYEETAFEATTMTGDLQPGGVGSGGIEYNSTSAFEAMSLKELRRLAQQKGISGVSEMKKKELIIAIRSTPIESFLE